MNEIKQILDSIGDLPAGAGIATCVPKTIPKLTKLTTTDLHQLKIFVERVEAKIADELIRLLENNSHGPDLMDALNKYANKLIGIKI